jgi:DNA-binding HxlR family transcriptional regulator
MRRTRRLYPARSPEARALNVLGQKWTLLIVRALRDGPQRFVSLRDEKIPAISTEPLQTRLAAMDADGLLTKTRYREAPPRVMYELTDEGRAASRVPEALANGNRPATSSRWAGRHGGHRRRSAAAGGDRPHRADGREERADPLRRRPGAEGVGRRCGVAAGPRLARG